MLPARFLGLCHERCQKTDTCKLPEGAKARLMIAQRKLHDMEMHLEYHQELVVKLQKEYNEILAG